MFWIFSAQFFLNLFVRYILWLEVDIIILHIKQLFSIVLLLICIIWLSTFVSSHAPLICFLFCFDLDLQLGSIIYYYYCTRTRYVPTRKRRLNTHYKRKMVFLHVIIANGFVGWTLYFKKCAKNLAPYLQQEAIFFVKLN